jgi:hypothetical protein
MAKETPAPKGIRNFKDALRKIVQVPKAEVDRLIADSKRKRRKK